jgi:hypothetical protein
MVFRFLLHFTFLLGESDLESLYAQRILDTFDFPTPTTEAMSLTVIDVCLLRATIFVRFFAVISIFTLAKTKIIPGLKHKLSTNEEAIFSTRSSQNWFANRFLLVNAKLSQKPEVNNPVLTICNRQNLIFTKISACPN